MTDPFADLQPLPLAELCALDLSDLAQPWTDVPDFNKSANPEIDAAIRLDGDRRHLSAPTRRLFVDYRSNPDAYRHLDPLPKSGESLHGIISGKYALMELIPAIIERSGQAIEELHLTTLSFSVQNGADLCSLIDSGHVKRLSLIISYYFQSTSKPIWDAVVPELLKRGQRVLGMRNHSKTILARMTDGTCYVIESSANLRSCVNVEQFVMTSDPELHAFHRSWMEDLLTRAGSKGQTLTATKTHGDAGLAPVSSE